MPAILPAFGDPLSPASTHISPDYLESSVEQTRTPNVVTAVLMDYRSLDTLVETIVIFTAGIACALILAARRRMIHPHDSAIVRTLGRIVIPIAQLFGFYVLIFGQHGPGGGFVGGVVLAASMILAILIFGVDANEQSARTESAARRWRRPVDFRWRRRPLPNWRRSVSELYESCDSGAR